MLRLAPSLLIVLSALAPAVPAFDVADPEHAFGLTLVSGPIATLCDGASLDVTGDRLLEGGCDTGEIRPGAWSYGCTVDFVMSDGTTYYIGTAGHCGGVGQRRSIPGVGQFGTTVFRELDHNDLLDIRDWALVRVDADKASVIDATMYRFAGPYGAAPGLNVRPPVPGDAVLQYGHGSGPGQEDATKGRPGFVLGPLGTTAFLYEGTVGGGDSGSPIRFATGEAAGIAVAYIGSATGDRRGTVEGACDGVDDAAGTTSCLTWTSVCYHLDGACVAPFRPGASVGVVVATRFDAALAAFATFLGRDLWVVDGALPSVRLG